MKKRPLFETNSSSSHSLAFADQKVEIAAINFTLGVDEHNIAHIGDGEYRWDWLIYSDPISKLLYLCIDSCSTHYDTEVVMFGENEKIDRLINICKKYAGAPNLAGFSFSGYIDHQSIGTSNEIFALNDEEIFEFIVNPGSAIKTGNDNDDYSWND